MVSLCLFGSFSFYDVINDFPVLVYIVAPCYIFVCHLLLIKIENIKFSTPFVLINIIFIALSCILVYILLFIVLCLNKTKKQISNFVSSTRFWNNLHQDAFRNNSLVKSFENKRTKGSKQDRKNRLRPFMLEGGQHLFFY